MEPVQSEAVGVEPMLAVPPVVAVVVTVDPGPWLDDTLASLVAQDYPDLSILVLDAASCSDPTAQVARVAPGAFVRRLEENQGYGAAANHVLEMVHGASYFLFCHDDVALDVDAVHVLVEEAVRSNAAVTAPKQVDWYDERRLLHVGMVVDKGGAVVDRVQVGEIDHGQHDAVRDVFLVSGGCTLVRADLFAELGGYDPAITVMGEHLDLCWRVQLAGGRVVVAPSARVRHLERLASGARPVPSCAGTDVSLQALQRRHELYVVLRCYTPIQLVRVVPQMVVLAMAELVVALSTGHRERVDAVVSAWRWNLTRKAALSRGRAAVDAHRHVPDAAIRQMQVRGSARLRTYIRRAVTYGVHLAHVDAETMALEASLAPMSAPGPLADPAGDLGLGAVHLGGGSRSRGGRGSEGDGSGAGGATSGDGGGAGRGGRRRASLAGASGSPIVPGGDRRSGVLSLARGDVPQLVGVPSRGDGAGEAPTGGAGALGAGTPAGKVNRALALRTLTWTIVTLVLLYGSRSLLASGFPSIGDLLPLPSWAGLWHDAFAGWQPVGVGATVSSSAGFGLLGLLASVLFGATGLLRTLLPLACLPVGAWGVSRLMRATGSNRARVVATVIYLAIPVPYNDLATGHGQAVLLYAAMPWIVAILARSARLEPFEPRRTSAASRPDARTCRPAAGTSWRGWRSSPVGSMVSLGLLDAVLGALEPRGLAVVLVVSIGLALGTAASGGWGSARTALRLVAITVGATAMALVLLVPWSVGVLEGPARWTVLFGERSPAAVGATVTQLLRLGVGPVGDTVLAYAFVAAAFLPLLIGGRWRLAWATRMWGLAVVCWILAWSAGRGWLGPLALAPGDLLAPAGLAMAVAAGLGIAAFDADLPTYRFGWRQVASVVAGAALVVSMVPILAAMTTGRWDLPSEGWQQAMAFMGPDRAPGGYRVLWLGQPSVLPGPSWALEPGLDAVVSDGPVPSLASDLTDPGPAPPGLVAALRQAQRGGTVELGRSLAPYAVRYVVVAESLAPSVMGYRSPLPGAVPPGVVGSLDRQIDLKAISSESGYLVFEVPGWVPERAVTTTGNGLAVGDDPASWHPVLAGARTAQTYHGTVPAGILRLALSPASQWSAQGSGVVALRQSPPSRAPSAEFTVPRAEAVSVAFDGPWWYGALLGGVIVLWVLMLGLLFGWHRWILAKLARRRSDAPVTDPGHLQGSSTMPSGPGADVVGPKQAVLRS